MPIQQTLQAGGFLLTAEIAKSSKRQELRDGLVALGWEKHAPQAMSRLAALRAALEEHFTPPKGKKYRTEPNNDGIPGYMILEINPKQHVQIGDKAATVVVKAKLDEYGNLDLDPWDKTAEVEQTMNAIVKWVGSGVVREIIAKIAGERAGVRLDRNFWFPAAYYDEIMAVSQLVESVVAGDGLSRVTLLTVGKGKYMLREIIAQLDSKIEGELSKLESEVNEIDLSQEGASDEAIRKVRRLGPLENKAKEIAAALDTPLNEIRAKIQRAGMAIANATLMAVGFANKKAGV